MSDCSSQNGYDAIMLHIDFKGEQQPWTYPLALNGREMERVTIGGELYERVRVCENTQDEVGMFACSECGASGLTVKSYGLANLEVAFCPSCGAKAVRK